MLRNHKKEIHQIDVEWQLLVNQTYNEGTERVRETVEEYREQQREAAAARRAAVAEAVARGETAAQLQTALERVRSTSKAQLLEEAAALKAQLLAARERRKAGQRTLKEAALDRRRAQARLVSMARLASPWPGGGRSRAAPREPKPAQPASLLFRPLNPAHKPAHLHTVLHTGGIVKAAARG